MIEAGRGTCLLRACTDALVAELLLHCPRLSSVVCVYLLMILSEPRLQRTDAYDSADSPECLGIITQSTA